MTRPFFGDFGKSCNGLFSGGYVHNFVKVNVKCKTDGDAVFTFGGTQNLTTKSTTGNLEARYKFKEPNFSFAEKWTTLNALGTEVTVEDLLTKNTLLGAEVSLQPAKYVPPPDAQEGENVPSVVINKEFKVKGSYKHEIASGSVESELKGKGSSLKGTFSIGDTKYITSGIGIGYDFSAGKFTERKIGFQLRPDDSDDRVVCLWYSLNTSALIASAYYKEGVIEGGITAQWSFSQGSASLGLATKYKVDDEMTIRAKIDEKAGLGFGFTRTFRKGFNITMSAMVNCLSPLSRFQLGGSFEIDL